jgi:hypothetical protein
MQLLELRLKRKRGYEISNEIYLELPNTRKKVRLEKVVVENDKENEISRKTPGINGRKLTNLDEDIIKLTNIKIDKNSVQISANLEESDNTSDQDVKIEVFRASVIPDWTRSLKIKQVLATSNVVPVTDMDFKRDVLFKSNVYDDEYDSNEECDGYPENGFAFSCE